MAWMKLEDTASDHPKIIKLGRMLGIERVYAFGHIATLWCWTQRMAPDGDLSSFDADDIEIGAAWAGKPGAFVAACVDKKLLDETEDGLVVHGFMKRAGSHKKAIQKRKERDAAKMSRDSRTPVAPLSRDNVATSPKCRIREERRGEDGEDRDDVSENITGTVTSHHEFEFLAVGYGLRPIIGKDAAKLSKFYPLTVGEAQAGLDTMKHNAATPGWGYLASCLASARKKPPPPKRDLKHGHSEPSTSFDSNEKF